MRIAPRFLHAFSLLSCALLLTWLSACSSSKAGGGSGRDASVRDSSTEDASVRPTGDAEAAPDAFDKLAGDGSEAFARIAEVWCDRAMECADRFGGPHVWATKEACIQSRKNDLPHDGDSVACDGHDDYKVEPRALASCLRSYGEASCPRIEYERPFVVEAEYGVFAACRDASAEILKQRDEREGRRGLGEPCRDRDQCGFHYNCVAKKQGECGTCAALPGPGEKCGVDSEGYAFCDFPFECNETTGLCARYAGGEGDGPGVGGCEVGLDPVGGRCQDLHREGKACDPTLPCGSWLACIEGECRSIPRGAIGQPCAGGSGFTCDEALCKSSGCVDRPGLGDKCTPDTCQSHYECVDGKCAKTPACGLGKEGDYCGADWQCGAGVGCIYNPDGPSTCKPTKLDQGQACRESSECRDGGCLGGTCQRFSDASPCDEYTDCLSYRCSADKTCVPALQCD